MTLLAESCADWRNFSSNLIIILARESLFRFRLCVFRGFFPLEIDAFFVWRRQTNKKKQSHKSPVTKIWHWTIQHTELLSRSHMGHMYVFALSFVFSFVKIHFDFMLMNMKKEKKNAQHRWWNSTAWLHKNKSNLHMWTVNRVRSTPFPKLSKKKKLTKALNARCSMLAEC